MTRRFRLAWLIVLVVGFLPNSRLLAQAKKSVATYRTIEQWPIGDQGHGRTIVTSIPKPSQTQLKEMVEQLKVETRGDKIAFVWIYDNQRAAQNRKAATTGKLSRADDSFHSLHCVGQYQRNASSGLHSLYVYLKGGESFTEIKY